MYESLGLGWGNSLLGFISIALIPVPLCLYRYGSWLRKRRRISSYKLRWTCKATGRRFLALLNPSHAVLSEKARAECEVALLDCYD